MTATNTLDQYTVHELLGVDEEPSTSCTPESLHESEVAGLDIRCGEEGFWREITHVKGRYGRKDVFVDAGPIIHRGALQTIHSFYIPHMCNSSMYRLRDARVTT